MRTVQLPTHTKPIPGYYFELEHEDPNLGCVIVLGCLSFKLFGSTQGGLPGNTKISLAVAKVFRDNFTILKVLCGGATFLKDYEICIGQMFPLKVEHQSNKLVDRE